MRNPKLLKHKWIAPQWHFALLGRTKLAVSLINKETQQRRKYDLEYSSGRQVIAADLIWCQSLLSTSQTTCYAYRLRRDHILTDYESQI